jgi:Fe-S-cluster containining protein
LADGRVEKVADREEIINEYRRLLLLTDRWFARAAGQASDQVQCSHGCAQCCRGLFEINLLDAWNLQAGLALLAEPERQAVLVHAEGQRATIAGHWPQLAPPYVLNDLAEERWPELMPEDDPTPCAFLSPQGHCLVYAHRPLLCRQQGIPTIDRRGQLWSADWCTLNFTAADPLAMPQLRWPFRAAMRREFSLLSGFVSNLVAEEAGGLDTLIPLAPFIDFEHFDWQRWWRGRQEAGNELFDREI